MPPVKRSPLALAVLALLRTEPMHPYQMQVLIREWAKDQVINVDQRSSLYRTIERLLDGGLVEVHATERDQLRPERTVYAITDEGHRVARQWLADMLATPAREFPEFPAALSFIVLLEPDEARAQLEQRLGAVRATVTSIESDLVSASEHDVPRPFLVESELLLAVAAAERDWLGAVIEDLRAGRLTWSAPWVAEMADQFNDSIGGDALQP